jgi:hypothetical protein
MKSALVVGGVALACALGCSKGNEAGVESKAMAAPAPATPAKSEAASAASANANAGPAADAGGKKAFGGFCTDDADCTSNVCFHKRLKTPDAGKERRGGNDAVEHDGFCSMKCDDDGDCPVPPTKGKCGARGMCKRPE